MADNHHNSSKNFHGPVGSRAILAQQRIDQRNAAGASTVPPPQQKKKEEQHRKKGRN